MAVPGITRRRFSGKDPSKVDRSAAYMGRYVAKNVVAAGLAPRCEVQIAYCIGVAEPVSVLVSSLGTSDIPDEVLTKAVREVFDLRPYHITKRSICSAPSTRRPPATATSAANSPNSRGNIPTQPPISAPPRRFERGPYSHTL